MPWKDGEVWQINGKPWYEAIPEEPVRELFKTKNYANPAVSAVAYHNLNKLQNGAGDVIVVPGEKATPEQRTAFEQQMRKVNGVPEKAEEYKLNFGTAPDEKFTKFGTTLFHEMGLSPANAQKAVDKWNAFVQEQTGGALQQSQQQNETEMLALETKWGDKLDEYKAAGQRVVKSLGLDAATIDKIEGSIGTAAVVGLLANLGMKAGEATWAGGGAPTDPNDPSGMTPQAAQAKITQLQGDAAFQTRYMNRMDPGHAEAVKTMEALFKKAGEKPSA